MNNETAIMNVVQYITGIIDSMNSNKGMTYYSQTYSGRFTLGHETPNNVFSSKLINQIIILKEYNLGLIKIIREMEIYKDKKSILKDSFIEKPEYPCVILRIYSMNPNTINNGFTTCDKLNNDVSNKDTDIADVMNPKEKDIEQISDFIKTYEDVIVIGSFDGQYIRNKLVDFLNVL